VSTALWRGIKDLSARNSSSDSRTYFTSAADGSPRFTSAFAQAWRILAVSISKSSFWRVVTDSPSSHFPVMPPQDWTLPTRIHKVVAGVITVNARLSLRRTSQTLLYLDAVALNQTAGRTVPYKKSASWREATKETREHCKMTLADLNAHRKEHGC
jgi:hypothetical protein